MFAPFGDDPVLLTEVIIRRHAAVRNGDAAPATLRWTEYWGRRPYEFFGADKDVCTQTETHFLRRIFAQRFKYTFEAGDGGLLERKIYTHDPAEYSAGPDGRRARDISPPATFLVPLNGEPATVTADSFLLRSGRRARLKPPRRGWTAAWKHLRNHQRL